MLDNSCLKNGRRCLTQGILSFLWERGYRYWLIIVFLGKATMLEYKGNH